MKEPKHESSDPSRTPTQFESGLALAAAELGVSEDEVMRRVALNLPKQLGVRRGGWAAAVTAVERLLDGDGTGGR